ncbi:NUDIX hydrolase [Salinicoccus sp. HZC-1]|uniref:NUDIX hydrolase n=1 Tax=Salinicoccus sp. HZC-1 TaxID=3385497 RepID=UPI00398A8B04
MDSGFKSGKNIFRYRVAGIIIEEDKVLLATNNMTSYYYTLSGAVNLGEASEDAAVRVLTEKTNVNFNIKRLLTIVENFFDYEFNDTKYEFQEVTFYYLMEPLSKLKLNLQNDIGGGRTESLHWMPVSEVSANDIRPRVSKEMMLKLPDQVETIINDERNEDLTQG